MKQIMRVVSCGDVQQVASQKLDGGTFSKRQIVLQELGGKYEDQYVGMLLGPLAQCVFHPGEVVAVSIRFQAREYNGQMYQDVVVSDVVKLGA